MHSVRRRLALGSAVAVLAGTLVSLPTTSWTAPSPHPVNPRTETRGLAGVNSRVLADSPAPMGPHDDVDGHLAGRPSGNKASLRPAIATARIDSGIDFGLIGVVFGEDPQPGTVVQVRVHELGGWTDWRELHVSPDVPDLGDPDSANIRPSTIPLLTDPADAAQVRIDTPDGRPPEGASIRMIEVVESPADQAVLDRSHQAAAAAARTDAPGAPVIISRAEWGADESLRGGCPGLTEVHKVAFVHHTASTSNYTEAKAPAQLRAVYSWTTQNGYCDYPYNFAVDKFGNIFEGRGGGIELPVKSGATASFNDNSMSVSALGDFTTPPSNGRDPLNDGIAQVIAWKLGLSGRTIDRWENLVASGYPGGADKGDVQAFRRVSGHRDAFSTACPGDDLYGQLAVIRELAAEYQAANGILEGPPPPSATFISPWASNYLEGRRGRYYRSSVRVRPGKGRTVLVKYRRPGKPWKLYDELTTDDSRWADFKLEFLRGITKYRLVAPATEKATWARNGIMRLRGRKPRKS